MDLNIRKLRSDNKLKQSDLAKILGVGQPLISSIESGRFKISKEVLEKVREHFPDFEQYISSETIQKIMATGELNNKKLLDIVFEQMERIKEKDRQISTLLKMIDECNRKHEGGK